jgi:hypothetical protein
MHARGLDPPVSCALRQVVGRRGRRGRRGFIGQWRDVRARGVAREEGGFYRFFM